MCLYKMGVCNVLPTVCEGAFENLFLCIKSNRWVGDFPVATGGGFWVAARAKQHSPGWHQEAELLCASFQCLSTHESCKIYIPAFCCPLERMKHISRCGIHKKDPVHQ